MPSVRRRFKRERHEWRSGHLEQLRGGTDDFNSAWGNVFDRGPDDRHNWPAPEVLAEMKLCWADCGEELLAEANGKPLWAQLVFEHGLSGHDAYKQLHPQTPAPPPNEWQIANGYA